MNVSDQLKTNWLHRNYFRIVRSVVEGIAGDHAMEDNSNTPETSTPRPASPSAMLVSPKRRAKSARPLPSGEAMPCSILDLQHTVDTLSDGHCLQCYLLHHPDEPRWAQVTNRQTKATEAIAVVTAVVVDHTGPAIMELWRRTAERAVDWFATWSAQHVGPPLIEVKYFVQFLGSAVQLDTMLF